MPWEIKKKGDQHCVVKKGTDKVVKCHPTREKALAHQRALYSNVHDAERLSEIFAEVAVTNESDEATLVRVDDVPIASTGIEYPLASGPTTFTEEDLADAVRAYKDPHVLPPRLKIGHTNPAHWLEAGGEPAFGKVENLRLGDNNQTIYGDYVGVPAWLADIMPTVYPSRSFEGGRDVETVGGNKYRVVINAVALLGVRMPGITSLNDLKGKFGATMPEGVEIAAESDITAAINVEDIRRQYYDSLDTEYGMWWVRAMQLNPNELIVDGDDGKLYRVPFRVKGDKTSFGEPVEVKIKYEDVAAEAAIPLFIAGIETAAEHDRREVTVFASRQEAGRDVIATKEGGTVLDLKDLAKSLGLPEDATEEQVNAEIVRLRGQGPGQNPGSGQAGSGEPPMEPSASDPAHIGPTPEQKPLEPAGNTGGPATTPPIPPDENVEPPEPVVAEDGTIRMDRATYDLLVRGARAGITAEQEHNKRHRESIVAEAVRDGKIVPASREHYMRLFNTDPAGTEKLLTASVADGGLAPGLIPVQETGHGGGNDGANSADGEGLPDEWFPTIKKRRELALMAESGQTRVLQETIDSRERA